MSAISTKRHTIVSSKTAIRTSFKKGVAVLTAACFFYTSVFCPSLHAVITTVPPAAPLALQNDDLIPYTAGRITDAKYYGSDTVVINIQDLHCHAEVQRNIARILGALDRRYGLSEVHIEGEIGKIDTAWASLLPDHNRREKLLDILLDSGRLTGTEYYAIHAGKNDLLSGLENEQPYHENIARLKKITETRDRMAALLPAIRKEIAPLKSRYFSARNVRLGRLIASKDKGYAYYRALVRSARKAEIDLYEYPALTGFLSFYELQKRLNRKRVSRELGKCLASLKQRLPYNAYRALSDKTDNFSRVDDLCVQLMLVAQERKIPLAAEYPALANYVTLIETGRRINPIELVKEERQLVRMLRNACAESRAEKDIVFLADYEEYLADYFNGRIAADDYRYFTDNTGRFMSLWKQYVSIRRLPGIEPQEGLLRDFYQVNIERNGYFLENLFKAGMPTPGTTARGSGDPRQEVLASLRSGHIKTVVTGGFHTPGFLELLRQKKISYIVITPSVTQDTSFSDKAYDRLAIEQGKAIPAQTVALATYSRQMLGLETPKQVEDRVTKDAVIDAVSREVEQTGSPEDAVRKINSEGLGGVLRYIEEKNTGNKYFFVYTYNNQLSFNVEIDREQESPEKSGRSSFLSVNAIVTVAVPAVALTFMFLTGHMPSHLALPDFFSVLSHHFPHPFDLKKFSPVPYVVIGMAVKKKSKAPKEVKQAPWQKIPFPSSMSRQTRTLLDSIKKTGANADELEAALKELSGQNERMEIAGFLSENLTIWNYRQVLKTLDEFNVDKYLRIAALNALQLDADDARYAGLVRLYAMEQKWSAAVFSDEQQVLMREAEKTLLSSVDSGVYYDKFGDLAKDDSLPAPARDNIVKRMAATVNDSNFYSLFDTVKRHGILYYLKATRQERIDIAFKLLEMAESVEAQAGAVAELDRLKFNDPLLRKVALKLLNSRALTIGTRTLERIGNKDDVPYLLDALANAQSVKQISTVFDTLYNMYRNKGIRIENDKRIVAAIEKVINKSDLRSEDYFALFNVLRFTKYPGLFSDDHSFSKPLLYNMPSWQHEEIIRIMLDELEVTKKNRGLIDKLGNLGKRDGFYTSIERKKIAEAIIDVVSEYNFPSVLPALKNLALKNQDAVNEEQQTAAILAMLKLSDLEALNIGLKELLKRQKIELPKETEEEDEQLIFSAIEKLLQSGSTSYIKTASSLLIRGSERSHVDMLLDALRNFPDARIIVLSSLQTLFDHKVIKSGDAGVAEAVISIIDDKTFTRTMGMLTLLEPGEKYLLKAYERLVQLESEDAHRMAIDGLGTVTDKAEAVKILSTFLSPGHSRESIISAYKLLKRLDPEDEMSSKAGRDPYDKQLANLLGYESTSANAAVGALSSLTPRPLVPGTIAHKIAEKILPDFRIPIHADLKDKTYFRIVHDAGDGILKDLPELAGLDMDTFVVAPLPRDYPRSGLWNLGDFGRVPVMLQGKEVFLNVWAEPVESGARRTWILWYEPEGSVSGEDATLGGQAPVGVVQWLKNDPAVRKYLGLRHDGDYPIDFVEFDGSIPLPTSPDFARTRFYRSKARHIPRYDTSFIDEIKENGYVKINKEERDNIYYVNLFMPLAWNFFSRISTAFQNALKPKLWQKFDWYSPTRPYVVIEQFEAVPKNGEASFSKDSFTQMTKEIISFIDKLKAAPSIKALGVGMIRGRLVSPVIPNDAFMRVRDFAFRTLQGIAGERHIILPSEDGKHYLPNIGMAKVKSETDLSPEESDRFFEAAAPLLGEAWGEAIPSKIVIEVRDGYGRPVYAKDFSLPGGNKDGKFGAGSFENLWQETFDQTMTAMKKQGFSRDTAGNYRITVGIHIDADLVRMLQQELVRGMPGSLVMKLSRVPTPQVTLAEFDIRSGNIEQAKKALEGMDVERLFADYRPNLSLYADAGVIERKGILLVPVQFADKAETYENFVKAIESRMADYIIPADEPMIPGIQLWEIRETIGADDAAPLVKKMRRFLSAAWGNIAPESIAIRSRTGANAAELVKNVSLPSIASAVMAARTADDEFPEGITLREKVRILARDARVRKIMVHSRLEPLLAETIDLKTFEGKLYRLVNSEYFRQQARKGIDTFVLGNLEEMLGGKLSEADITVLVPVIRKAKDAGVRLVFDYKITPGNMASGEAEAAIDRLMTLGFDGYRLHYSKEPAGFAGWLSELRKNTPVVNVHTNDSNDRTVAPLIAVLSDGRDESPELKTLIAEHKLYRLVLLERGQRLEKDRMPDTPWVELLPQNYETDEAGAAAFKSDLDYVMGLRGASVVGMDSGILPQGDGLLLEGVADFKEYFLELFNVRLAIRNEDPAFRYESGRAEALQLTEKNTPSFTDEQRESLLNVLRAYDDPDGKQQGNRAALLDTIDTARSTMPSGAASDLLETFSRDIAKTQNDAGERERVLAMIAGAAHGLLEKDAGRRLEGELEFESPRYTALYNWLTVEAQLAAKHPAATGELTNTEQNEVAHIGSLVEELEKRYDRKNSTETPAQLSERTAIIINELDSLVRQGKPGVRPAALKALLDVLERFAEKKNTIDVNGIKKNIEDSLPKALGLKKILSAA